MASSPLITFKAGRCDQTGRKVKPVHTPGYAYLYLEDDLLHFCWRPRSSPSTEPEIDLIMFPNDGSFQPLLKEQGAEDLHSPTTGRIYVLAFSSSGQKHYFWMQSKSQHKEGSLSWFSQRDQRIGQIVDALLQGEDINVEQELDELRNGGGDEDGDQDDMDVDESGAGGRRQSHTGGAGADATGGDPTQEGEASREGGADGGRAPQDATTSAAVQSFLNSLSGSRRQAANVDKPYTTLPDLLPSSTTVPYLSTATPAQIDQLCSYLPTELFSAETGASSDPTTEQKRSILGRVLRSPQLTQSLASLTSALHDGGLPMIGEALGLNVRDGGNMHGSAMPLGGGRAVEGFVEGVKRTVEEEEKKE